MPAKSTAKIKSGLKTKAAQITLYLNMAAELKRRAAYYRTMAGLELNAACQRVEDGESKLSWEAWCAANVPESGRNIYLLMALRARVRSGEPIGLRAAELFQAYDQGVAAYLRGVPQKSCPFADQRRHAAWRTGWCDMEARSRMS